ncbi:deleted in malignant brain tumors 1 protein-like [Pomacea canaliculata]|uniref:deleted in malignant brain tumors 1 protein-like n=1 Tax=Pomacea canaliculata TaxID=400727 RepID=UPI000D72A8E8|nr:deleted in malignant brain tumors 1 protein-like [Pomacea canaliculata]
MSTPSNMMYRAVSVYWISVLLVPSVAQQMSARVVGGTADAGRLEIWYDGTWGTVCEDGFGQRDALVACRMLGFNSTTAVAVGSAKYGAGSGPILFNELQCVGHETSLAQCPYSELYRHNCGHWDDVGVMCNFNSAQQMSARVVGGTADAGRLELLYDETWNTVCGYRFGTEEALVACRMLGFNRYGMILITFEKLLSHFSPEKHFCLIGEMYPYYKLANKRKYKIFEDNPCLKSFF